MEENFGVLEEEGLEKMAPIPIEQALGIEVELHTKHKR